MLATSRSSSHALPTMPLLNSLKSLSFVFACVFAVGCIPSRMSEPVMVAAPASQSSMQLPVRNATYSDQARPATTATSSTATPNTNSVISLPTPSEKAEAAHRYVGLSGADCENELKRRNIAYSVAPGGAQGVDRAIRLMGPLHGVEFHEGVPKQSWHTSVHEILDCRLALALDDFAVVLAEKGISEVVHVSMYRKNAHIAGKKTPSQHAFGRAIDIAWFVKRDGKTLNILRDWQGAIGDTTCGPEATAPHSQDSTALELRSIVCEAAARGMFHRILTPNFNKDHENHLHIDLEPKANGCGVK